MDGQRFDDLARGLQHRLERRAALKNALKIGAGSALGLIGLAAMAEPEPTLAKSCKKNKDCPKGKKCKNKKNGKGRCK